MSEGNLFSVRTSTNRQKEEQVLSLPSLWFINLILILLALRIKFFMILQSSKIIGAGLAVIALGGAAIGVGIIFGALVMGVSRNPSLRAVLMNSAILGFALTEALGLFALMMALMFLFAF